VLILGGTAEARGLADVLDRAGITVISSLAGRVTRPRLPVGGLRIGGFGGPAGLARWLEDNEIGAVLDATHPFAERISASAAQAAARCGVPLLRLERPGWTSGPGDRWIWVDDLAAAAAVIGDLRASRVFLTSGRQGLAAFAADQRSWFLIRCVERPEVALPPRHQLVLDRGPYTLAGELSLIDLHAIDLIVTKNSGGSLTAAKLAAARDRGLPVVIVRRPPRAGVASVATVPEASAWACRALLAAGRPSCEPEASTSVSRAACGPTPRTESAVPVDSPRGQ
jgi:precorrin-6A/cobalt-precorrin-6A reductase